MFDFKNDDRFLAKWLNDELTEEELKTFKASEDFIVYEKIKQGTNQFISPDFISSDLLEEIKGSPKELSLSKKSNKSWFYGIAAAIIILIGAISIIYQLSIININPEYGKSASVELPDGSMMIVNAKSHASYNKLTWGLNRNVELEGEAFFKVIKGEEFTVSTDAGNVRVLGTEFNVFAKDSFFEVTCYEGRVEVTTTNNQETLEKGTALREFGSDQKITKLSDSQPSWLNQQSTFKSVPVKYVLQALENQYGITFEGNLPADDLVFSGSFPHNNQELALKLVFGSLQIDFNFKGEKTVVLEN